MNSQRGSEEICLKQLVEHMFQDVFTPAERSQLLARIEAWESENPGRSAHHRITAWIDIAYHFQAEQAPAPVFGQVRMMAGFPVTA